MRFFTITRNTRRILLYGSIGVLLIAALIFRTINLNADPASGPFLEAGDEGTHSYAARSLYLNGTWRTDGVFFAGIMPVYPLLQVVGLYLFGLHIYAFRFINIIASVITSCVVYFFLKKEIGKKPALVGVIPFLISPFYLTFVRTGLPEGTMILFSILSLVTLYRALTSHSHNYVRGVVAGCAFVLAFFTKQSSIWLVPTLSFTYIIFFVYEITQKKKAPTVHRFLHSGAGFVAAIILSSLLYLVIVVLPNKPVWLTNFTAIIGGNRPHGIRTFLQWFPTQFLDLINNPLWGTIPILVLFACMFCAVLLLRYKKERLLFDLSQKSHRIELMAILSLFFFLIYMILIPAPYARFLVGIIIPLSLMFALLFEHKNYLLLTSLHERIVPLVLALMIVGEMVFSMYTSYEFFIKGATFNTVTAARQLKREIPANKLATLPVTWLMETNHQNINTFLTPLNDYSISSYFNEYGRPVYFGIRDDQLVLYEKSVPRFFSTLRYATKIQNYIFFETRK